MEQNKLIPMSDIRDEVRQIAVAWAEANKYYWIGDKHNLASDIQNYSNTYADQQVALNGEWNRVEDYLPPVSTQIETYSKSQGVLYRYFSKGYENWTAEDWKRLAKVEYWKPQSLPPGSNQGPTKVQLIETIAQREQVIRDRDATISDLQNQLKKGI